jgi:2-polyprenyl-6-methoxyphenol hydroxylase-like FAD-dependent oxidoreductase
MDESGSQWGCIVRIACVGGGPAGLYFSLLMKLWNSENDVTVFERNKEGVTHGWGVTMEHQFLAELGGLDATSAREIERRSIRLRDQEVRFGGRCEVSRDYDDAYGVSRQQFVDILATRGRQLGVDIRYEHDAGDGSDLPAADLIVATDGVNSQLRAAHPEFGTTITERRNRYIWLGTSKVVPSFDFFFQSTKAGWIWAYAYQHEPRASTFIVECGPGTWAGLGFDRCSPMDALDRLETIFAEHLAGHRLWAQFPDGTEARWRTFRTVSNDRWHHGNVVLAGDSAHTTHFSVGLGTTLALKDVIALAGQLRGAGYPAIRNGGQERLVAALEAYEEQRRAGLGFHATEARRSAQWFENVPRYTRLKPGQFARVLHSRRAPLLPLLPPRLFCLLHDVRRRVGMVDRLRNLADR